MSDQEIIDTIADDFTNEIVGNSSDYNGGRLTLRRSRDLAAQALAALHTAGYAVVKLPEPDYRVEATDDVNGFWEWEYPHGSIAVADDGCMMWDQWHFYNIEKLRAAAAALLAAADKAEEGTA